jgi:WbqC-like protein family
MTKSVAIHQPNYLPWMGYFYKIWATDVFIFHDNVEFTKKSFTKRVFIRNDSDLVNSERAYLIVPLKQHSDSALIKDLFINQSTNWQQKHLNKLRYVYGKAPFFKVYFPLIEQLLAESHRFEKLSELNKHLIVNILECLDIQSNIFQSSEIPIQNLRADDYNAALVEYVKGVNYLSGTGASAYQTESTYQKRGITLRYNNFAAFAKQNTPPQYPKHFDVGLSIVDSLFYIGAEGILTLFRNYFEAEKFNTPLIINSLPPSVKT